MVTFRLEFSNQDMVDFFRRNDIAVTEVTYTKQVPVYHNRFEDETITTSCVVNPHNGHVVPVSVAFEKVIYHVKNALLLNGINRLTVLNVLQGVKGITINNNENGTTEN